MHCQPTCIQRPFTVLALPPLFVWLSGLKERRKRGKGGEGGGMFKEEVVERGRRRGIVWGGRGVKWEKERECVRRKSRKGEKEGECVRRKRCKVGEGGGMSEEEEV
jgi:hypothetical protein